jgi:Phytanoyl-CoA dioxygenase (PhyH)
VGLSRQEIEQFRELGFVKRTGAFPAELARAQCEAIWSELAERHGVSRGDRDTWRQPARSPRSPKRHASEKGITAALHDDLDDLLGAGSWEEPADWGLVLFTFPNARHWRLPAGTWHWDSPIAPHRDGAAALHVFALLERMRPGGGATLFVQGMHHLTLAYYAELSEEDRRSKHAVHRRRVMARNPWLRQLMGTEPGPEDRAGYFMERETRVEGAPLRVHEMTGEPGDVYLCHPLLAHSGARNALDAPRVMRGKLLTRRDFDYFAV